MKKLHKTLYEMDACSGAVAWSKYYGKHLKRAWKQCPRPEWIEWLIGELMPEFSDRAVKIIKSPASKRKKLRKLRALVSRKKLIKKLKQRAKVLQTRA